MPSHPAKEPKLRIPTFFSPFFTLCSSTFAVAAVMLEAGLREEAFTTAKGIYHMVYEDYGLWFQTPEALSAYESVRAISYMRPLAIWAMQWVIDQGTA